MFGFGQKYEAQEQNSDEMVGELVNRVVDGIQDAVVGSAIDKAESTAVAIINAEGSIVSLKKEKARLEDKIVGLNSKARLEETEMKALLKLSEERQKLSLKQKEVELQSTFQQKELDLVKQYHADLNEAVDKEREKMETFMTKVMDNFQGRDIQVIK